MLDKILKVLRITALCIVAALIVAALLYFVPWSTPVDLTLNAVKLDENGNEIGTAEIHIKGHKLDDLFRDSRLDVDIEPFDVVENAQLVQGSNGSGSITTFNFTDVPMMELYFTCNDKQENDFTWLHLTFTEEMDCFVLRLLRDSGNMYYVASSSGNYDTQGVIDYFKDIGVSLVPGR